jgi:glyoxylase-like metal-dependent hydrolase (beta-lactamase superfamily II)
MTTAIPTEPLPLAGGRAGAGVRVHPLRTANMLSPPALLQRPGGRAWLLRGLGLHIPRSRWMTLPIPCFLVEHPEAGPFLIDTGLHASVASDPSENLGKAAKVLYSIDMEPGDAAPAQVAARGVDPAAIGLVVMTHLHYDHAGGATQFPNATFLVERREWEAASNGGFREGYHRPHLDPGLRWRAIDVDGESDLFGDGSVRLLHTPGHTPGHLSLLLRLQSGARLLLTADAAYAQRTLDERLLPLFAADDDAYLASLDRLIELRRDADHVVCGHDPDGLHRADGVFD